MAVGVFMEFPGVTWEQYEQLEKALDLSGPPEGELIHVCGPTSDGGWRTVDVWESQEAFERLPMSCSSPTRRPSGFPSRRSGSCSSPFTPRRPDLAIVPHAYAIFWGLLGAVRLPLFTRFPTRGLPGNSNSPRRILMH